MKGNYHRPYPSPPHSLLAHTATLIIKFNSCPPDITASVKETLTSDFVCFMLHLFIIQIITESPGLFGTNRLCLISRVCINPTVHSKKVEANKEFEHIIKYELVHLGQRSGTMPAQHTAIYKLSRDPKN